MTSPAPPPAPTRDATPEPAAMAPAVPAEVATRPPPNLAAGILGALRPKQWTKNVLVFAAPGAAGVLSEPRPLALAGIAFAAFCMAASGTYLLNDTLDRDADRRHPVKRHRPIASGVVPIPVAVTLAVTLLGGSVALTAVTAGTDLTVTVAAYVGLTVAYSAWLKHIAVVDLAAVAAGFVLRAVAGGTATGVPLSNWFLIVTSFASLFMVAGKRHGEHVRLGADGGGHRATLDAYSADFLRHVRSVASAVAITAYCLWAFETAGRADTIFFELSIAPFVLAMLRYGLLLEAGRGEAPEDLVLSDRPLQVMGVLWAAVYALGVYAG